MRFYLYLLLSSLLLVGCTPVEHIIKRGDNALAIGEYAEAAGLYKNAYQRLLPKDKERRAQLSLQMGKCYLRYGNTARALGALKNAERYGTTDSTLWLLLGDIAKTNGDYKAAQSYYNTYQQLFPNDSIAAKKLTTTEDAANNYNTASAYTVKVSNIFNSGRTDYCPALFGKDASILYFTTTRRQVKGADLSGVTALKPGDIYFSKKDEKGKWKLPEPLEGGVNTNFDEGACAFNPSGTKMYLTVCREDPQYPRLAEIWESTRSDAAWSKPTQLKLTSDTLSSYAHPAISPNEDFIYFASDMPGGYGGLDIWRASFNSHGTGPVENLGPSINTAGNECFPAFRPNGELYFASDGQSPNFGGLDLYRATEDSIHHSWNVIHLPAPMNSPGNDFGITFEGARNRGFFSSSRATGGRGWDKIYEFSYPDYLLSVKGWVYEQDAYELPAAVVYMIGDDGTNKKLSVLSNGSFEAPVKANTKYLFLATCNGYLNIANTLVPDSSTTEHQYVLQFPLPNMNIPVLVRNVFYQFDKAAITDSSKVALDRLAALLKDNPHITIELSSNCDYRGTDAYNDRLSQQRAENVVHYLISQGIPTARLTPKGYGKKNPKIVSKKLAETYTFLKEGDTLTTAYIMKLPPKEQEICNALNRRTEFRVLRTTYGLFDEKGNFNPSLLKPQEKREEEQTSDSEPAGVLY